MLEVDDVLSSEAEIKSGAYTGEPLGNVFMLPRGKGSAS